MTRNRVCEAATLHWVGKEIDASLDEARDALGKFAEGSREPELLDETMAKLRQIRGTLLVIELYGAAMFAEELEAVARVLVNSSGARTEQAFEALMSGMVALPGYLSKLQDGMPDVPISLLPLMNDLRAVRDQPLLSDTSLFTPGLEQMLDADAGGPGVPSDALQSMVRGRRHEFHLRLLNWYRAQPDETKAALDKLGAVVDTFREAAGTVRVSRLFETASAVISGMREGAIEGSAAVKLLIGRLVRVLKAMNEGGEAVVADAFPVDLVKNLLYYIATASDNEVPAIAELRTRYHLVRPMAGEGDLLEDLAFLGPSADTYEAVRTILLGELTAIKDRLELALHSEAAEPEGLAAVIEPLYKVSDTLGMVGLGALRRQLLKQAEMLKGTLEGGNVPGEQDLMGLARDLVYAESTLQGHIQERARDVATAAGTAESIEGLTPGELERHRVVVFGEIKNELSAVKSAVSAFIADPGRVDAVESVPNHLNLAAGALRLLGHERAADLTGEMHSFFEDAVRERRANWSDAELVDVADLVAGIDYYVDLMTVCPAEAGSALDFAETARNRIHGTSTPKPQPAEEEAASAAIEEDKDVVEAIVEPSEPEIAAPATRVTPTKKPPPAAVEEADSEIHDIFIEEAREQREIIEDTYGKWRLDPEDNDSLTVFRRAFHTLKGSGRMVGALAIGEYSWAVENLLNRVIDGSIGVSDEVLAFLDDAIGMLPELVEAEAERRAPKNDPVPLEARAFALLGEQPPARVQEAMSAAAEAEIAPPEDAKPAESLEETFPISEESPSEEPSASEEPVDLGAEPPPARFEQIWPKAPFSIDPELAVIFREEVQGHIGEIGEFLGRCAEPAEGGVPVSEVVVRAFHTLHGSANMAGVTPIAELSAAAERLLKSLRGSGRRVDALSTTLLSDAVAKIAEVLDTVNVRGAEEPEWQKIYDDLNGLWPRLEQESSLAIPEPGEDLEEVAEQSSVAEAEEEGDADLEEAAEAVFEEEVVEEILDEAPEEIPEEAPSATEEPEEVHTDVSVVSEPEVSFAPEDERSPEPSVPTPISITDFSGDPELIAAFNEEARELFEQMEDAYTRWQHSEPSAVGDMQRVLHTLKGAARLAGIPQIGDLSHAFESMLGTLPSGTDAPPAAYRDLARRTADRLMEQGDLFAGGKAVPAFADLVAQLEATAARGTVVEEPREAESEENPNEASSAPVAAPQAEPAAEAPRTPTAAPERVAAETRRAERIRISTDMLDRMVDNVGEVGIYAARLEQQQNISRFNLNEMEQTVQRLRAQLRALELETEAQILYRYEREGGTAERDNPEFDPLELDRFSTIQELSRALAETVDDLGNIREYLQGGNRDAETLLLQQSRIVSDLQNALLRTRLVPFTQQVSRLERLVRQTSAPLGKVVRLAVDGRETELDRSVLDHTVPLLEHLLRNAVSHGIESPEERRAEGKAEQGTVTLRLARDGMDVVLTVEDDGKGLDAETIRARAIEHGAISADQPLDDEDVYNLILLPGISTASELTQISGRGVGLDVVSSEVKQLGGNFSITSTPGIGSSFTIRLPFTLAITDVLLVQKKEDVLAIPHTVVESVVRVPYEHLKACLEGNRPGIDFAGRVYPVRHIAQLFGEVPTHLDDQTKWVPALLVRSGERRMALQIDGILGTRQIVVKSLGPQLNVVPWLLGGTILADGKVALIVDVTSLVRMAAAEIAVQEEEEIQPARQITVMVVDDSITVRRVTSRLLERHNMNVVTAKDGVEAIALLQETRPDVMLLDIEMPRMDGFEVARHVRNNAETAKLPIVMITSRTGEKHRERARSLGVDQYLGKPYQEDELLDTIFDVLAGAAE